MNGFSEKSRASLFTEKGENQSVLQNRVVQNVFDTKNIVIDII